jgi:MYXO-CTERM domain-containing protein
MKTTSFAAFFALAMIIAPAWANAQEYGGVQFPEGAASFADEASFFPNDATGIGPEYSYPVDALGVPDYNEDRDTGYISIGNTPDRGVQSELLIEFIDNKLINGPGDDLVIFEVGPNVEDVEVAIAADDGPWENLGPVDSSTGLVDLQDYAVPDIEYNFVRIRDIRDGETSFSPRGGPDIDAVGAINTVVEGGGDATCTQLTGSSEVYGGRNFTHGAVSFADQLVWYDDGTAGSSRIDALNALDEPDGKASPLGSPSSTADAAQLTVLFKDNYLRDVPGDDLYIFQLEPQSDAYDVAVSPEGDRWYGLGRLQGRDSVVDLADFDVPAGETFRFVRLTADPDRRATNTQFIPPEIDAIGAIASCDVTSETDSDNDGVADPVDQCPYDSSVESMSEDLTGESCSWPAGAVDQPVECNCSSSDGTPGGGILLFGAFVGLALYRRRRER